MKIYQSKLIMKGGKFLLPMVFLVEKESQVEGLINNILSWDECVGFTKDDINLVEDDHIFLDPGGLLYQGQDNKIEFTVNGLVFNSYLDKLGGVLDCIKNGVTWFEGFLTIKQFHYIVHLPLSIVEPLKDALLQHCFSDAADKIVNDVRNVKNKLISDGYLINGDDLRTNN